MNMVSAGNNNRTVSAEVMCSSPSIKYMCIESSLSEQPNKHVHNSVNMALHDKMNKFWHTLSTIEKKDIENCKQEKEKRSICSVNQPLHDNMSTKNKVPSPLDIPGVTDDLRNIIDLCSMCSVNGGPCRAAHKGRKSGTA